MDTKLNDALEDLVGSPVRDAKPLPQNFKPNTERSYVENCPSCGGSGLWRGIRRCFKCNGSGKLTFKTPYEDRQKAKQARATKLFDAIEAYRAAHPQIWDWMKDSTYPFAVSLRERLFKFGGLTDGQERAAYEAIAKYEAAKTRRAEEAKARHDDAKEVNTLAIEEAFGKAREHAKKPKLYVGDFVFSFAPVTGKNAGALYVKSTDAVHTYLGKIAGGKFFRTRECSSEAEAKIVEIANDPKAAALAHGKLTTCCAVCNKTLTNPESIERGIGPICAAKFGW